MVSFYKVHIYTGKQKQLFPWHLKVKMAVSTWGFWGNPWKFLSPVRSPQTQNICRVLAYRTVLHIINTKKSKLAPQSSTTWLAVHLDANAQCSLKLQQKIAWFFLSIITNYKINVIWPLQPSCILKLEL